MESTVMISSLLCNILIGCFCIVVLSWAVVGIQTIINDFKCVKREEKINPHLSNPILNAYF